MDKFKRKRSSSSSSTTGSSSSSSGSGSSSTSRATPSPNAKRRPQPSRRPLSPHRRQVPRREFDRRDREGDRNKERERERRERDREREKERYRVKERQHAPAKKAEQHEDKKEVQKIENKKVDDKKRYDKKEGYPYKKKEEVKKDDAPLILKDHKPEKKSEEKSKVEPKKEESSRTPSPDFKHGHVPPNAAPIIRQPFKKPDTLPSRLHVGRLTRHITKDHLKEIFGLYGNIKNIDMPMDRNHFIYSRGFAYIEFETTEDAANAQKFMNGGQIDGQEIIVAFVIPMNSSRNHKDEREYRKEKESGRHNEKEQRVHHYSSHQPSDKLGNNLDMNKTTQEPKSVNGEKEFLDVKPTQDINISMQESIIPLSTTSEDVSKITNQANQGLLKNESSQGKTHEKSSLPRVVHGVTVVKKNASGSDPKKRKASSSSGDSTSSDSSSDDSESSSSHKEAMPGTKRKK